MQALNQTMHTLISSKIKNLGTRTCESCGSQVPILEREGKQVSVCLTCQNKTLEADMTAFRDKHEAEAFFWNNSLVPSDTEDCFFDNYNPRNDSQKEAFKKAKWYAENFKQLIEEGKWNSLLLQGSYGLGKSHLSHSIAMLLKSEQHKVIFADIPMLMKKIRSTYGNKEESEITIFKNIEKADLVIFDDLGAEYVKSKDGEESWAVDVLFGLIGSRVDKANIFTTNYDSSGLIKKYGTYGGRIVSRMMKGTKVIKLDGKDYRTQEW